METAAHAPALPRTTSHPLEQTDDSLGISTRHRTLWWLLRIGAAMCFIGHGAFGVLQKAEWLPYFALVGIPAPLALSLMPVVGVVDIAVGISVLVSPRPVFLLYMAVWGLWTAMLRPLAGDGAWEMLERAGNYGVPMALLLLAGIPRSFGAWRSRVPTGEICLTRLRHAGAMLRLSTAMLLAGHGALGALTGKTLLVTHYAALGLPSETVALVGWLELALAAAVLARPGVALLLFVCGWKVTTEALFPLSGAPLWEFIERGGSYAAPLGAALIITMSKQLPVHTGGAS
ncbi:MAG TPA: hypothetical protein VK922_01590 [Gemmatimonadaceae bacterium]|nr:hypothetical protein [Gemmatimonadaceae bacterium]